MHEWVSTLANSETCVISCHENKGVRGQQPFHICVKATFTQAENVYRSETLECASKTVDKVFGLSRVDQGNTS